MIATRPATRAGGHSDGAHAARLHLRDDTPRQGGRSRGRVGDQEGVDVQRVGRQTRSGVEAEPAEPQERGPKDDVRYVVGLGAGVPPLPDEQRRRYRSHSGVYVDDGAAGKVQCAVPHLAYPAAAPYPVGDGGVHEGDPYHQEYEVRRELEALDERARYERRRDDGEHHLEYDEQQRGDAVVYLIDVDAGKAEEAQVPHERATLSERQAVSPQHPDDAHHGHGHEAVHERADDVSGADEASVEEGEPGRHEQHQGRSRQHPGGMTRIHVSIPLLVSCGRGPGALGTATRVAAKLVRDAIG